MDAELKRKLAQRRQNRIEVQKLHPELNTSNVLIFDMMYLFKSNYSVRPLITENGVMLGGTVGALNTMLRLIKQFNSKEVICVFDGKEHTKKRKAMFSEYKANRSKNSKDLSSPFNLTPEEREHDKEFQLKLLIHLIKLLPVKAIGVTGYEADDIIGFLTKKVYKDKSGQRIIVSADKDFIQLIDSNTVYYYLPKKHLVNLTNVHEFWDVPLDNVIYVRCVEGDKSDNVSGISGIALTSLIKLMPEISEKRFTNVEDFCNFISTEKAETLVKSKNGIKLLNGIDIIKRNYEIMQLTDIKLNPKAEMFIYDMVNDSVKDFSNIRKINDTMKKYNMTDVINPSRINSLFSHLKG
jgi:5'-3' exonuclease